jgi:hypothetical protein
MLYKTKEFILSRIKFGYKNGLYHKATQRENKFRKEIQGLMKKGKVYRLSTLSNFAEIFEQLCVITFFSKTNFDSSFKSFHKIK